MVFFLEALGFRNSGPQGVKGLASGSTVGASGFLKLGGSLS